MQKTQKNNLQTVNVPARFVEIAKEFYSGSGSMLYAVASTGHIMPGRPKAHNAQQNHVDIVFELFHELNLFIGQEGDTLAFEDRKVLVDFREWARFMETVLRIAYDIPEE